MRRLVLIGCLAVLLPPAMAHAQDEAAAKPRRMSVIPPTAAEATPDTPAPKPFSAAAPSSPASPPLAGLSSLSSGGASQCRAQCAEARYACVAADSNGDGGECATEWSRCDLQCGGDGYRYSSTAPQVFTQGFAPR